MRKFSIFEKEIKDLQGDVLLIVDVQKEFQNFIPGDFVENLNKYANNFKEVYQIWDGHKYEGEELIKIEKPSYKFNNQIKTYRKIYGTIASEDVKNLGEKILTIKKDIKEGDIFKINDDFKIDKKGKNYMIRIENNHKWFYVNSELVKFFKSLKGKDVILTGGAEKECLKDIEVALSSIGVNYVKNHNYVYSAEDKQ